MSSLLKYRIELFEAGCAIKEGVQYLEYFLLNTRSLEINRLIVFYCGFVF